MTLAVIPLFSSQSFAQSVISLEITTDQESYDPGNMINISGQVSVAVPDQDVLLQVISPRNNIVEIAQVDVDPSGNFSTDIETSISGVWKESGNYTIRAFYYNDTNAEIQFGYGLTSVGVKESQLEPNEEYEVESESVIDSTELVVVEKKGENAFLVEGINVNYTINGGKIISITPDLDAKSLIIKISTTDDGELVITLPKDVIDTDEGKFFVLVDGEITEQLEDVYDDSRTLTIPFYYGSQEIEIIGTFVIPEFGTIAALILVVAIASIIAITAKSRVSLMPKL